MMGVMLVGLLKGMLMMLPPSKTEHGDCEDDVMALSLVGGSTIALLSV